MPTSTIVVSSGHSRLHTLPTLHFSTQPLELKELVPGSLSIQELQLLIRSLYKLSSALTEFISFYDAFLSVETAVI